VGPGADFRWQHRFLAPNHLIEQRPDGFTILQVLPLGPGRSLVRRHGYTLCEADRPGRAAGYLASRLSPHTRASSIAVAESTQNGIVTFGYETAMSAQPAPAVAAFRRQLVTLMPVMSLARPPHDV
jgi:hypothetical protein